MKYIRRLNNHYESLYNWLLLSVLFLSVILLLLLLGPYGYVPLLVLLAFLIYRKRLKTDLLHWNAAESAINVVLVAMIAAIFITTVRWQSAMIVQGAGERIQSATVGSAQSISPTSEVPPERIRGLATTDTAAKKEAQDNVLQRARSRSTQISPSTSTPATMRSQKPRVRAKRTPATSYAPQRRVSTSPTTTLSRRTRKTMTVQTSIRARRSTTTRTSAAPRVTKRVRQKTVRTTTPSTIKPAPVTTQAPTPQTTVSTPVVDVETYKNQTSPTTSDGQ